MTRRRVIRHLAAGLAFFAVGTALLVIFGGGLLYRNASARPLVAAYDLAVPGWMGPPLRLVQISDSHAGPPDMPQPRLDAIVDQVNALAPDLVVLTGDYEGEKLFFASLPNLDLPVAPFRRLRSRLGSFAVRGNHDDAIWAPRVLPRYGLTYLQNDWVDAGPVVVAGVDDWLTGHPAVAAALAKVPADKPVILLMHEPVSFAQAPARVALTLAGHTHGGQIRLPLIGSPWLPPGSEHYVRGLYVEGGRRLIVSSGVGTTGFPLRLGVPPEIVVVTLHAL